jgi:lipopolysaccharide export system permease protein
MTRLDRYLIREFVRTLVLILVAIGFLYLLVHFFERMDTYIDRRAHPRDLALYYATLVPYIVVLLLPMGELLAVFFSLGEMVRRLEILALRAAGIRTPRILLPFLLVGVINVGVSFALNEGVVFRALRFGEDYKRQHILKQRSPRWYRRAENLSFFDPEGRLYAFRFLDGTRQWGQEILIAEFDAQDRLRRLVLAASGQFLDGHWRLQRGTIQWFQRDSTRVESFQEQDFPEFTVPPEELMRRPRELEEMSLRELLRVIHYKRAAGLDTHPEEVEVQIHFSFPFANLVMLLFALPLALMSRGKGRTWGFGMSLVFAFVYWTALQMTRILGQTGHISPLLAGWFPNVVFLVGGGWMLFSLRDRL